MIRFWGADEIAEIPGIHPQAAHEFRMVKKTGVVSNEAVGVGYNFVVSGAAIGTEIPMTAQNNTDGSGQGHPVYLSRPTEWQFYKTERCGYLDDAPENYRFICAPLQ